jgi:two-component system sensor histidine kinase KdpD
MADRVEEGIERHRSARADERPWETRESVVVAVTGAPSGEHVVRRAARLADRQRARLVGVHVRSVDDAVSPEPSTSLEFRRSLLRSLGGEYREVTSGDVSTALVDMALEEGATQLVVGSTRRSRWVSMTRGSLIREVLEKAPMDVHVIASRGDDSTTPEPASSAKEPVFAPRRRAWAWLVAIVGPILVVALLVDFHPSVGLSAQLLMMVLVVTMAAVIGGGRPALAGALEAFVLSNWFFIPPLHQLSISSSEDAVSLFVFLGVAVAVGTYVSVSARRAAEALSVRSDASTLAALAGTVATSLDPLPAILDRLRDVFDAEGASLFDRAGGRLTLVASSGPGSPVDPHTAERRFPIGVSSELVLAGGPMRNVDRAAMTAFLDQLTVALEQHHLRSGASEAIEVATANQLRAALLAAVSHDLRTPLAAVKTAVSGLRQPGVEWPPDLRDELLATIEEGADQLNSLITNLLDLTRIQSGAVELRLGPVRLDEVVHRSALTVARAHEAIQIEIDDALPGVLADATLLEHVVANLLDNAVKWSPPEELVRVDAGAVGDAIHLRVVDRGPGIPMTQRDEMFLPFRRGDGGAGESTGLGLAVASGFARLMGMELLLDDTPGGGTTATLVLRPFTAPTVGHGDA